MSVDSTPRSVTQLLEVLARRVKVLRLAAGEASTELRPLLCPHCRRARFILDVVCDPIPEPRKPHE